MKIFSLLISMLFLTSLCSFAQPETVYPEGLQLGDIAPDFMAFDQDGNTVHLKELLKKGPVVLLFYRGQWCPYCNKQLSHLTDSIEFVKAKGATVLAISPETKENIQKTIQKTKATFPVLADEDMSIMSAYKAIFTVDEKTINRYKGFGIDLDKANGKNGPILPVPATYIIGIDGKLKYVFFDTNYKKRISVKEIFENL